MTDDGDAERLRRRLYLPGADPEDVTAYLDRDGPEDPPAAEEVGTRSPPHAPRWPIAAAVLVAIAVIVVLGVVRAPVQTGRPGPAPTPLPTSSIDAATSAAFAARVGRGADAGLAAWWDRASPFVEEHGVGARTVDLPPPSGGGRITVLLVLATDATAGWSVARLVIHDDRTIHLSAIGSATGGLRAGVPAVGRVRFTPLTRPVRLLVDAPPRVRWGVAAVYSG